MLVVAASFAGWYLISHDDRDAAAVSPVSDGAGGVPGGETAAPSGDPASAATPASSGGSTPGDSATSGDTTASEDAAGATAHTQASAIDRLIDESKPSRNAIGPALQRVRDCSAAGQGLATIRRVAESRHAQGLVAATLAVDAIDGGEAIKQHLVEALEESERADQAYARWARRYIDAGCRGATEGDRDYDAGNAASARASAAKTAFVTVWNPIAEQEGLPTRAEPEI